MGGNPWLPSAGGGVNCEGHLAYAQVFCAYNNDETSLMQCNQPGSAKFLFERL